MSDDSIFGGLKNQVADYAKTLGRKALSSAGDQVDKIADKFDGSSDDSDSKSEAAKAGAEEIAEGKSPAKAALSAATAGAKDKIKGVFGGGSGGAPAVPVTSSSQTSSKQPMSGFPCPWPTTRSRVSRTGPTS